MPVVLDDEDICSDYADRSNNIAAISRIIMLPFPGDIDRFEAALRLLRDVAMLHGYYNNNEDMVDPEEEEEDSEDIEDINALVPRIQANDPTLTSLALRNVQTLSRGHSVSSFRGFTPSSIQQATEALHTNHTIRSVSCRYEWRYPRRMAYLLCNDNEDQRYRDAGDDQYSSLRATSYNQVTKLQERRFFEACVCLPQLESISLTGGHRWRISHLMTILDTAKGLKKLVVRDVLVKSSSELNGLKRLLMGNTRRNYNPILLEAIELTIEDQTDRDEEYWSTTATIHNDESPFDGLLESLISSPNTNEIKVSKSILSRFHLRPVHDVSTKTLLKLAKCRSLSKLVLSEISVEKGGIEAMCESLMQKNGHMTHLEFYGCAFNQSVGQSDWNAMFRLIEHDPTIQIRASSLVYLQRQFRPGNQGQQDVAREWGELGISSFVQRPREDFSFSLRDEEGAKRHFRNRGLDVRYMLQEAGFFRLIRSKHQARSSDWIDVMTKVKDDSIALFYVLRENPALCDRAGKRGYKTIRDTREDGFKKGNQRNASTTLSRNHSWRTGSSVFSGSVALPSQCLCSTI